eukprot:gene23435-9692_t
MFVSHLLPAIRGMQHLHTLVLEGNNISDLGIKALCAAICSQDHVLPALHVVNLHGNHASESGLTELRSVINDRRQQRQSRRADGWAQDGERLKVLSLDGGGVRSLASIEALILLQ